MHQKQKAGFARIIFYNDFITAANESAGNAQTAQVQSGSDHSKSGTGENIEHDMLADGDRGIKNAKTPQPVEQAYKFPGTQLSQQAVKPDGREHGKGHMQGRTDVARGIYRLEKCECRMLRPVGVGP
jgi:hypothetical protein